MKPPLFLLLLVTNLLAAQPNIQQQATILERMLEINHYGSRPFDDEFSAFVFDQTIKALDEDKLYFTQADIDKLSSHRLTLDDEIRNGKIDFLKQLSVVWKNSLTSVSDIARNLQDQPVKFTGDAFNFSDAAPFTKTTAELSNRWNQYFQYNILDELYEKHETDSLKPNWSALQKEEPGIRKRLAGSVFKNISASLADTAGISKKLQEAFLASIASYADPHTEFFPADKKENFDEALSSERKAYGFLLDDDGDDGYKIAGVTPGSPAWSSGNIHVNDKVVGVKKTDGKTVNLKDATSNELAEIFANDQEAIELTVESADGKQKTVTLRKEMIDNDDNFVKGYVLNHNGRKTGYISLPSFYTAWGDNTGSSCANDVAKEIVKLKQEGIESLLLDLRYNGGGSVQEALELSGIFIDAGPLALAREKSGKTYILKDPSRGTIYDGPLGVMINGQSASASELVASTLQDYHRGVVIGSRSFGKATMQIVMPMDTSITMENLDKADNFDKEKGFLKVTTSKLFRINGHTNQLEGVVPDVSLPDPIEVMDYTERKLPQALPSDTTMKKVIYTPLAALPLSYLSSESSKRVGSSDYFNGIKQFLPVLKTLREKQSVPMQWDAFVKWQQSTAISPSLKKMNPSPFYTVSNAALDQKLMQMDAYQKQMSEAVISGILEDPYIEEAVRILDDLVSKK